MVYATLQAMARQFHPLTPEDWALAEALGEARRRLGDGMRHSQSDRQARNEHVDLLGALAETFLLRTLVGIPSVQAQAAVQFMQGHIFNPAGTLGNEGPDVAFTDAETGRTHRWDAKSFDCSRPLRWFAINARKHRSLMGRCSGYLCVLASPYGNRLYMAGIVPYGAVDEWQEDRLRPGGTTSKNLAIGDFIAEYCGTGFDRTDLAGPEVDRATVAEVRRSDWFRQELGHLIPTLVREREGHRATG